MTIKPGSPFYLMIFLCINMHIGVLGIEKAAILYLYMKYFSWTHTFFSWNALALANPVSNKMQERKKKRC